MTLDEAIRHAEEVAEKNEGEAEVYDLLAKNHNNPYEKLTASRFYTDCAECAADHRQLVEWLKELKEYKEQSGDAISRNDVIDTLNNMHRYIADELTLCSTGKKFEGNEVFIVDDVYEEIAENLPSVNSQSIKCDDAISRQAVIDALDAYEAAELRNHVPVVLRKRIKDLPSAAPQPCEDAISRRDVLNAITMAEVRWQAVDNVNKLPSVTPQPKTGRWIPVGYDGYADGNPVYDWWECSECGWEHTGDEESLTAFCPNCGAKMEVEG